jgi:hypothetical protein
MSLSPLWPHYRWHSEIFFAEACTDKRAPDCLKKFYDDVSPKLQKQVADGGLITLSGIMLWPAPITGLEAEHRDTIEGKAAGREWAQHMSARGHLRPWHRIGTDGSLSPLIASVPIECRRR